MMPTAAVEADVLQPLLVGRGLALVAVLDLVVLRVVRVTEDRVVVERDLGVERLHLAVLREDQRVDLGEVAVGLGVGVPQLQQDLHRAIAGLGVEVGGVDPRRGTVAPTARRPGRRGCARSRPGSSSATCSISMPPCADSMPRCSLGGAVERERCVVLARDVARLLDPEPADDVTLDVEAEDVLRVQADLLGAGRQLHPAGLAAPADEHLRLHDDRIAETLGRLDRLVGRVRDLARRHRDAVAREQLLSLVFEQVHLGSWLLGPDWIGDSVSWRAVPPARRASAPASS